MKAAAAATSLSSHCAAVQHTSKHREPNHLPFPHFLFSLPSLFQNGWMTLPAVLPPLPAAPALSEEKWRFAEFGVWV